MDVTVGLWRRLSAEELMLLKTLESPLDCKEIQPVHSKGDQPWVFFGRNDAEAETPVLWPPHAKSWLIGKDSDAERDWRQEKKGTTEDEMAGWHHWPDGWVWVSSGSWWWTGRPGVLWFMGSQRVGHDWATELNWKRPKTCIQEALKMLEKEIRATQKMERCTVCLDWKNQCYRNDSVLSKATYRFSGIPMKIPWHFSHN